MSNSNGYLLRMMFKHVPRPKYWKQMGRLEFANIRTWLIWIISYDPKFPFGSQSAQFGRWYFFAYETIPCRLNTRVVLSLMARFPCLTLPIITSKQRLRAHFVWEILNSTDVNFSVRMRGIILRHNFPSTMHTGYANVSYVSCVRVIRA